MSYRISILDKSPLAPGETAAQALARTLTLAQQAERWGYHRFWIAEHHNAEQLASPSPELLIAWILGQTRQIRVGSGGVMLQHYSPYKVAENFNLLASLAPGRVDLGVGKAPGGLPLATRALQQGIHQHEKGSFAEQLTQLDNWLTLTENQGEESLRATPIPPRRADGFLLGASVDSARLAASCATITCTATITSRRLNSRQFVSTSCNKFLSPLRCAAKTKFQSRLAARRALSTLAPSRKPSARRGGMGV
ncbi:MsnO8 family LLM class oxidoreductase, partial [Klebsiella aerogenes]